MPSILFVCTANRYRSPIAEACFKKCLQHAGTPGNWKVRSAGTWAKEGLPPVPNAIQEAEELGLEIHAHRSQQVDASLLAQSELVLVMESGQKEALQLEFPEMKDRIRLLTEMVEKFPYDIPDPISQDNAVQKQIVHDIYDLVTRGFNAICSHVQPPPKISP